MAFKSKDGKREFSMSSQKSIYDRGHDSGGSDVLEAPGEDESESQDPNEVAAEHGPAQMVQIHHGESEHEVDSEHPDGHKHHSTHASASEAHEHAKQLAGAEEEPEEPSEEMEGME